MAGMTDQFSTPGGSSDAPGVPRERQYGRYVLPSPDGGERWVNTQDHGRIYGRIYTRTTTFAKSISDNYTLNLWGKRMAVKGLTLDDGLLAEARRLTLDDRDELNALVERAEERAGSKTRASIGTALHTLTEQIDAGQHPEVPALWAPEMAAYVRLTERLEAQMLHMERVILNPQYDLGGTFDRIVSLGRDLTVRFPGYKPVTIGAGTPLIWDLKTGRDLSYGWGEIAIQETVYTDAPWMWEDGPIDADGRKGRLVSKPWTHPDVGLVAHVPVRDDPMGPATATLYAVNLVVGRAAVDLARQVRNFRKMRNLVAPLGEVKISYREVEQIMAGEAQGELPPAPLAIAATVSAVPWETRIRSASSPAELSAIWREASSQGAWTPELEALGHQQIAKLKSL